MKKYITSVLLLSVFSIHMSAQDLVSQSYVNKEELHNDPVKTWDSESSDGSEDSRVRGYIEEATRLSTNNSLKSVTSISANTPHAASINTVAQNVANPLHQVDGGDIFIESIGFGMIIKSQNGQCWRYTPDNSGNLSSNSVTCPNE